MPTHCNLDSLDFGSAEGRSIVAGFDGGQITSNSGALLLGATDKTIACSGGSQRPSPTRAIPISSSTRSRRWSASA